jgi:SEC-C motif
VTKIGRNDPCSCGSGKKYKKCCQGRPVRENRFAVISGDGPEASMDLVIETGEGLAVRRIPPAMPLRLVERRGKEAEDATHGAAATWGLPDFVFPPSVRRRASGVRELGDGLIAVGDVGIVLQVKSRESPSGDDERERRWIDKQVRRAQSQGSGTVRELRREPGRLTNLRGRTLGLDADSREWLVAVVIDHPEPPADVTPEPSEQSVVLLRRDWDFLFDQLKSTQAVGRYLRRVAGEPLALGDEPVRYYDLALADENAEASPLSASHVFPGVKRHSEPLLPMAPVASEDESEHRLYRTILEDIANIDLLEDSEEELRLLALADLDRLFPRQRALVSSFLMEKFEQVAKVPPTEVEWHQRRITLDDSTQIALGVCSRFDKEIQAVFGAWVQLRHHEFTERTGAMEPATVGVLLTACKKKNRLWDTSMTTVRGRIELDDEELEAFVDLWKREQDVAV